MDEKATTEQIIRELEAYRVKQRAEVKELRNKLQMTYVELREKRFSASMRACRRLDSLLRKETQVVEGALLQFAEKTKEQSLTSIGPVTLVKLVELVKAIDDHIALQGKIPGIVKKEGQYQLRFPRAYDILLGNRALLEHMLRVVERDTVAHATMELVTRLHEVNMIVPQLPQGNRRKELADYKLAFKNIGIFIRFVKKTHKIFCTIYPDEGM
ncbi:MAG TPA: hypothetical protein VJ579_04220 [Candidatus Paceibacterota bacterium]|nr:hypothetical protein [Candidatus Paceibacterota bacterium]